VLPSNRHRSIVVVCFAASGVRARAPPRAPFPLVLPSNVSPQNVCVPSLPPSMPIAPALPPLPTWFCPVLATTLHLDGSLLFAPKPSAALPWKVLLTTLSSEFRLPMAPELEPELLRNVEPTTTPASEPLR
jgi:hypothetical protein